ncbi:hypothetical protein FHG87_004546 [Trinorchestia longiramus]|nr:hypothetical protein FHG87_004546 [Trinorchestia longiramus]
MTCILGDGAASVAVLSPLFATSPFTGNVNKMLYSNEGEGQVGRRGRQYGGGELKLRNSASPRAYNTEVFAALSYAVCQKPSGTRDSHERDRQRGHNDDIRRTLS